MHFAPRCHFALRAGSFPPQVDHLPRHFPTSPVGFGAAFARMALTAASSRVIGSGVAWWAAFFLVGFMVFSLVASTERAFGFGAIVDGRQPSVHT